MTFESSEIENFLQSECPFLNSSHQGPSTAIEDVAGLSFATCLELSYATEYTEKSELQDTNAGVIICLPSQADFFDGTSITCDDPKAAFVLFYEEYIRQKPTETQIHTTAVVSSEAEIGQKTVIAPFVYVGPEVTIGRECWIQPNTVIGTEGFGFARDNSGTLHRQVHEAGVYIGDNVEIGANNCIDTGVFKPTTIGSGTKTDNLVHIPHNATVGKNVMITVGCMLSGNATIEDHSYLHPQVTVGNWATVGEGSEIGSHSTVLNDIPPYSKAVGSPAEVIGKSRYADDH